MVNKEFDQSRYQAGRLEAKTRNAFLGKKHQYDLKAQFLSNPSAPVETFNPLDQKFIAKLAGENPQQQERLVSFVNNFQTFEQTFGPDLELQNAPLIWQAMDHIEALKSQPVREKILNQIKAKKEQAKQVTAIESVLQPEDALKNTISTIWQLQSEKFREGLKSILDLPFFIINNLPDRVYRVLPITTILALVLSACASVAVVPNPEIPNQNDPVPGETAGIPDSATGEAPVITNTAEPASTITSAPTETQVVNQVDQLLTAHLAGESIDVSVLSPTEFREFSTQLAEQRNEERGINPIIYNNEAYVGPDNYMMMDYDGHPDMNETIQMYLPVVGKDSAGNLQILNQDGQTITIANSADVDWNMVVTDPNDPRIDWPNLPVGPNSGLTPVQYLISDKVRGGNESFIIPTILLDKTMGQIFMEGRGKGMIPSFRFLTVADIDENGIPISFRLSLVILNSTILTTENSDFLASAGITVSDNESFFVNLQENSVYYMGIEQNQDDVWDKNYNTTMNAYQGLITDNRIISILTHQAENAQEIMLLPPSLLIQKK